MAEITLSNGMMAMIDDADHDQVSQYRWHHTSNGYAYAWNPYPTAISMHRLLMQPPKDMQVDHINHNGLDNRRVNLRIVTPSQNSHHKKNPAKGYHWDYRRNKWKAMISLNGRATYLGRFDTEEEAATAYAVARMAVFGEDHG